MTKKARVSLADLTETTPTETAPESMTLSRDNVTTLQRDNVSAGRIPHTSLYLPAETKRAIREIGFQFDKKPHDLYIEGINLMLAQYGKPPVPVKK